MPKDILPEDYVEQIEEALMAVGGVEYSSEVLKELEITKAKNLRKLIALVGVDNVIKIKEAGYDVVVEGVYLLDNYLYGLTKKGE